MSGDTATERVETSPGIAVRPRRLIQATVSLAFLAAILVIVFRQSGSAALVRTALDISAGPLALAFSALVLGTLLAAARVKLVAGDLGYRLSWRDALSALGLGQLAGAVFFQLAGQLIARGAYLSRRGIPVGASVLMVGYERLLALGISLLLATIGAWYLFGRIAVDLEGGGDAFVKLFAGLVLATGAGAWLGWGRVAINRIDEFLGANAMWRVSRGALLSLGIQLATASAYVTVAHSLAPDVPMIDLAAASFIVMLVAALPISLAGWGVREFSAVLALSAVGVSPAAALLTAALIGIAALIAVVPLAGLALTGRPVAPTPPPVTQNRIDYNLLISMAVPLAAATAVFFQVYLPTAAGGLNVNLADPFAILGGGLFLMGCVAGQRRSPSWRLSGLNFHVLLSVIAMTVALLIGAARFGWTDWALANKYVGWFVLLAYGATGALIVAATGSRGLHLLLRTFMAAGAAIAALELLLLAARSAGMELPHEVLVNHTIGFAQNRNAFAFQMLMIICVATALALPRLLFAAALVIALAALWATGSRAGYGAMPVILAVALYMRAITLKQVAMALAGMLGLVLAIVLVEVLVDLATGDIFRQLLDLLRSEQIALGEIDFSSLFSITETKLAAFSLPNKPTNTERLRGILGGIELFRAHPIIGAGLGSFMDSGVRLGGGPQVIHSTIIWLLAEMGLVGLLIFAAPVVRIFWAEIRRDTPDIPASLLVMIIGGFAVMSLVHEMLYQRTFWLLLGAALAGPVLARRSG